MALMVALIIGTAAGASAQLVINELMQSNIDCLKDDLNEFPDSWVELYNAGGKSETLSDYKLGDSDDAMKAYALPSLSIAPGGYVVVFCDKADQGLHTDFRLDSGKGGSVYLFRGNEIADQVVEWKKQPAPNVAFGRRNENDEKWGYQAEPTPGAPNCGVLCKEILGEPHFSVSGGVISDAVEVSLNLPENAPAGAVIRYTLDGSEPTKESQHYTGPIFVKETKVVRAKVFCDGYLSPRSTTHSYIMHPREMTLPVVSIVTDDRYFYSDDEGIYVEGSYSPGKPNYEYDWRRPINLELFDQPGAESVINQLCETRVKGGASRVKKLKSLVVYANKRFGTKRFSYDFFPDQTPGIKEFKSFELRNAGNDFDYMYMRDAVIQQSMGMNADLDWQPSQPAILYINGAYMGILNIRSRSNEDYVYSYYDGLEDIDMIENWWELKAGSWKNFNEFRDFYSVSGHSFEEFKRWMDVEEFCNLMIMNIFFDNKDFPGNNIVMWRPQAEDGKWRWIAKDTDLGMGWNDGAPDYPTLKWITTPGFDEVYNWANSESVTRLFRNLLATPEFRDMFIDRCAVYMADFLTPGELTGRIDRRYSEMAGEYGYHRDMIDPWWPVYADEIGNGRKWCRERWGFFYGHLADFFSLGDPVPMTIDKDATNGRTLIVNGVPLVGDGFNGKYFAGKRLVVKSVSEGDGLCVTGWRVTVKTATDTSSKNYDTETLDIEMPGGGEVEITSVLGPDPTGIDEVTADFDDSQPCELFDLWGRFIGKVESARSLPVLQPGIYLLRQERCSRKILVK